ncbi:flavin reductase family protein [Acidisoma cellulosilyticum]
MAALAGGVNVITTGGLENSAGLTATAVCSLSADPPSLIVCVNKEASAHEMLLAERRFAVNVLTGDHRSLALQFAKTSLSAKERFGGASWTTLATGAPVLSGAAAVFDCVLDRVYDGYSHSILIGLVQRTLIQDDPDGSGLVWHGRRFRGLVDLIR